MLFIVSWHAFSACYRIVSTCCNRHNTCSRYFQRRNSTYQCNVVLFSLEKKNLSFFSFYKTSISLQIFLRCWCNHFFYNIRSPLFLRAPESVLIYIYIYIYIFLSNWEYMIQESLWCLISLVFFPIVFMVILSYKICTCVIHYDCPLQNLIHVPYDIWKCSLISHFLPFHVLYSVLMPWTSVENNTLMWYAFQIFIYF